MSLRAQLLNRWLRLVEKPALARAVDPAAMRRRFELNAKLFFHPPRGTRQSWTKLATVRALEISPRQATSDHVILYIHGGGFVFGSPRTHAAMVTQLVKRLQVKAVLPQYRLSPEAQFPAAVQDVRMAWDALRSSGVPADHIIVGGDSAGGCLALGLLAALCAEDADLPAGVFCFSPLTDLTYSGDSFRKNAKAEVVLPAERADEMSQMYLGGHPADDPVASPLFAMFSENAAVWITVGDTEILHDDTRRVVTHLKGHGADVTFEEQHDLPHVWPIFHNILPEARETLDSLADWIKRRPGWQGES